jgi:UDP-N-acetylmuramyl tripeptide synthase
MPNISWFAYVGPNRRSEISVVELTLDFEPGDRHRFPQSDSEVRQLLLDGGILEAGEQFPIDDLPGERNTWYSSLLLQTARLIQSKTGHHVEFTSLSVHPERNRCTALLEHEHCNVGMTSVKLATEILLGKRKLLTEPFRMLKEYAQQRLLPAETRAIMEAARRKDIPCVQLEQQPYKREQFDSLTEGECIRLNGLLMLGHGVFQHVLEGVFCLDHSASLRTLLNDRNQRALVLESLNIPLLSLENGRVGDRKEFFMFAVNQQLVAVTGPDCDKTVSLDDVHATLIENALLINRELGLAPVAIRVVSPDISRPQVPGDEGIVDFDLAFDLDQYLEGCPRPHPNWLDSIADAIVDWLFPDKSAVRMPIIAVTGTNGKTTTTRMLAHIMSVAGHKPGLVCTDGIYLNGREVEKGDKGTNAGHLKVLASKDVDMAVLEAHHAGLLWCGFAFRWCDIAICLNVTEDHLSAGKIETVEQMAEVKRALPERARHAAVLNADDQHCLAMINAIHSNKICLVSMTDGRETLAAHVTDREACLCVLEVQNDDSWVVIYDSGKRLPVVSITEIPATHHGRAGFNVSNAMHAIVAGHLAGVSVDTLSSAMRGFDCGYKATPGRLNIFDDLPFRVIMDFAHNPDGFRKVSEFIDQQEVSGRKLVAFSGTGDRTDTTLKNMSKALAGHFDHYFCKEYVPVSEKKASEKRPVVHIMRAGLLEAGVPETQVSSFNYGKDVIFEIFDTCSEGDLLVMFLGYVEMHLLQEYIAEYAQRSA